MNKHLDEIQQLWTLCHQNGRPVVFVISFQKELFRGHFLMGKMHTIEVTPLKPKELLKAYKLRFGSPEPFTEEALLLITELSRGVFRRFLKYIGLCLERVIESEIKIDIVDIRLVKETITLDQLSEDMDLELSGIFRRDDKKMQAVRALNLLREKGESNQKELAEKLNMHPNTLSRLLDKLEANNYVKRRRGLKKELLVSLK